MRLRTDLTGVPAVLLFFLLCRFFRIEAEDFPLATNPFLKKVSPACGCGGGCGGAPPARSGLKMGMVSLGPSCIFLLGKGAVYFCLVPL